MKRRRVLQGLGALGLTGGGAVLLSGSVAAQSEVGGLVISGDGVTTDDGRIESLMLNLSGNYLWNGYDDTVTAVRVNVHAVKDGVTNFHSGNQIGEKKFTDGTGGNAGSGGFTLQGMDVLSSHNLDASYFEKEEDGESQTIDFTVHVIAEFLHNGSPMNPQATMDTSVPVTVTNEGVVVGVTGEGNVDAYGPNDGNHDVHYLSPKRKSNGEWVEQGAMELFIDYGTWVTFTIQGRDPWFDETLTYNGDPLANVALGLDSDADGVADFQIAWKGGDLRFDVVENGGWKRDVPFPTWVKANQTGDNEIVIQIHENHLDSSYKFLVQASAGGEEPAVDISTELGKNWQGPNGSWISSYYYITETYQP